jgi:hypothetical protein
LRRYTSVLAGLLTLGALVLGQSAHAQFGSLRETSDTEYTQYVNPNGKAPSFKPFTVFFSPYTLFQRTYATVGSGGESGRVLSVKTNDAGPLVLFEKLYRLDQRETFQKTGKAGSTFSLGTWYWYHNSKIDRYSVYGKYFFNNRYGLQGSIGGDTHLGLSEYYGFFLYNIVRSNDKNKVGVQIGAGPYLPRTSQGDVGYTGTAAAAYNLTSDVSLVASLWYVNYKQKFEQFGFDKTSTTVRYTVGAGYSF